MKTLWFASCLVAALAGVARGGQIAYEGVPPSYPPGALAGNGPAPGFAVPWIADGGVVVVPAGLSSPLALPSMGGAVAGFFNYIDPLSSSIAPTSGKEFWASFLLFHSGPNDQTFMGLSAAGVPLGALPSVAFGVRLGQYGIFVGSAFTPAPTPPFTPNGSTDLLVTHFVAGGGTWNVSLYVNPSSFAVPNLVMNVPAVTYGTMVNHNQSEFESDEFRLGDTAGDVAAAGAVDVPAGPPRGVGSLTLRGIAPNPFASETTIWYEVPSGARAQITILDVRGRVVATLRDDASGGGLRSTRWNATDDSGRRVASGVYFVRLAAGQAVKTGTLRVVR